MGSKVCSWCGKALTKEQTWTKQQRCSLACRSAYLSRENQVKHTDLYDEFFLQQNTQFRAYFLGLFVTDGNFSKTNYCVSITSTDESLMKYLVEKTNYEKKLYAAKIVNPKHKQSWRIMFYAQVTKDMIDLIGYYPGPKTGKEFIPKCIDDSVFFHFLRGMVDGNGSIIGDKRDERLRVKVCSASKFLLQDTWDRLKRLGIVREGGLHPTSTIYSLSFGHEDGVRLCEKMYENAEFWLERKKRVYLAVKDSVMKQYSQLGLICCISGCGKASMSKGYCQHHYYQRPEHTNFKKDYYRRNKAAYRARQLKYTSLCKAGKQIGDSLRRV